MRGLPSRSSGHLVNHAPSWTAAHYWLPKITLQDFSLDRVRGSRLTESAPSLIRK